MPLNVRIKLLFGLAVAISRSKLGTISGPRDGANSRVNHPAAVSRLFFIIRDVGRTWGTIVLPALRAGPFARQRRGW
jgi:hypothetical protein